MRFLSFFRSSDTRKKPAYTLPALGRYSDSCKLAQNYAAWNQAQHHFEQGQFMEAYQYFFQYLRDETSDNVRFSMEDNQLRFEIFQGSRKIEGTANAQSFRAEAKIASYQTLNVGFMRRLAEKNFALKYSRFALDHQGHIAIVFDSFTMDGAPYKLYFALKEVATNADKLDDLLIEEFKALKQIENDRMQPIPDYQKERLYQFIQDKINATLHLFHNGVLPHEQYPGGYSYSLLNLVYKLDYLTQPEGYMMETLERMHRLYFSTNEKTGTEKNQVLARELSQLAARTKEDYFKEMYQVPFTFGITAPVEHDQIIRLIDSDLYNMNWYLENGHPTLALAIPEYIVGYALFNYAPPKPIRELLQLYYLIAEPDFFLKMGFINEKIATALARLDQKYILEFIQQIALKNQDRYPLLTIPSELLVFDNLVVFARSYLFMIQAIDPAMVYNPGIHMEAQPQPV